MQKAITYPFPLDVLQKWTLQDVVDELQMPERIVDIKESAPVKDVVDLMARENVSSLLVYLPVENGKEYHCFITLRDVIRFVVFQVSFILGLILINQLEQKDLDDESKKEFDFMNVF